MVASNAPVISKFGYHYLTGFPSYIYKYMAAEKF